MKRLTNLIVFTLILSVNVFGQFGQNKVNYKKFDWFFIQTKHFDLYFSEEGKLLAEFASKALEDALESISSDINYQINNRISIIIYNSHNDFQETNTADIYLSQGIGGFTEPFKNRIVMPFDGDYSKFKSTLHHELVHAVMNDMLYGGTLQNIISKNITLNLPQWYKEGMSEYLSIRMETKTDQFMRNVTISESLPEITRMGGYISYRAGESLFFYIAEKYGHEKVGEILTKIKNNGGLEAGFKAALGLSMEELSENWHKYLKKQYWPEIAFRADPDEFSKRLTGIDKDVYGSYNASSVVSPRGDKVAFISNRDIFLDVYILNTLDGEVIKKIAETGKSMDFEEVNPLYPSLCWAPDNKRLVVVTKTGGYDTINIIDTETEESYKLPFVMTSIGNTSWSPDGKSLAFVGMNAVQSDIYLYEIESQKLINFTNDQFTETSISWYPDSKHIVFSSDRGEYLSTEHLDPSFDIYYHSIGQFDLYTADIISGDLVRVTDWPLSYEQTPVVSPDGKYVLFISDYNGIDNIYKKRVVFEDDDNVSSITDLPAVPITNSIVSIQQLSLTDDGMKLVFDSEYKDGNNIFIMNNPFEIDLKLEQLEPTHYMSKLIEEQNKDDQEVPELMATSPSVDHPSLESRPAFQMNSDNKDDALAEPEDSNMVNVASSEVESDSTDVEDLSFDSLDSPQIFAGQFEDEEEVIVRDSVVADYSNYIFGREDVVEKKKEDAARKVELFKETLDDEGNYLVNRYKINFSPDLVYANAGYGTLYGLMGTTVLSFSDMLGNHRLIGVTSMQIDLKNSDYGLSYMNLENRTNYGVSFFHTARFVYLSNGYFSELHRFRNITGTVNASYPISRFERLDFALSLQTVTSENLDNVQIETQKNTFTIPSVGYTYDNTFWGYTSPIEGTRFYTTLFGDPGLMKSKQSFYSIVWDYRKYFRFWFDNSFVIRFSGGYSGGANPQRFILGGTDNWLNRKFKTGEIPLKDASDFAFLSPALPLRGYDYAEQIGTKYSLVNLELRMPLIRYLVTGPIPILLSNIMGTAFVDVGTAWEDNSALKLFKQNTSGKTVTDNLLIGTGFGARMAFFFLWRLDVAWTYDLNQFSKPRYYFSIGLDF
ncbi:MAG: biopolymer transporter Tol [Bacteroidetes bacterium]|nr:biopolymer transporter Tol [Bacteroidota bacterium]